MGRLAGRIRAFARLPGPDRVAAVESYAVFWFFVGALKIVPFRRFTRVLGPAGPKHEPAAGGPFERPAPGVRTVARSMRRIARGHPDTCLAQALTGRVMLRRRDHPSEISFGVRAGADGAREFHAWLVHDGVVLTGGGSTPQFSVISTFYDDPTGVGR